MNIMNLTNIANEILRRFSKSSETLLNGHIVNINDNQQYAVQVATDATYTYTAQALPGTPTTSAEWRVKRVVTATGVTTWADGNSNFDNLANNLSGLSYS